MRKRLATVAFLAWIALSLASRLEAADSGETTVRQLSTAFITSFNSLDWEKFRKFFDDDATIIHPAQFPRRLQGRAQYEKAWLHVFSGIRKDSEKPSRPYMQLQPQDLVIQMLGDVAIVTFHLNREHNS